MSKQAVENSNYSVDSLKKHLSKDNGCSRPKVCSTRVVLELLMPIDLNNTKTCKLFHANRNLAQQWKKEYHLSDVLHGPNDDNVVINHLKEVFYVCKELLCVHDRGVLLSNGIKTKQDPLRSTLKGLKNLQELE